MKQIILPTILEFTRLVIDSFMKENSLAQKGNQVPNTEGQPKNLKFSQSLTTRQTDTHTHTHIHTHTHTHIALTKKYISGWGVVYAMEKKDTNTDYPKLVSLGDQK